MHGSELPLPCETSVELEKERVVGEGEVDDGRMNAGLIGVTGGWRG